MGEYKLGDALKGFLNKSRLNSSVNALKIEGIWEEVMGKTVARYTDKLEIIGTTLFVTSSVGPLKQELSFQKEKIIERVNEAMGDTVVKAVIIQ